MTAASSPSMPGPLRKVRVGQDGAAMSGRLRLRCPRGIQPTKEMMMTQRPDQRTPEKAKLRELNDQLRQTMIGGQILITTGIQNLPAPVLAEVTAQVQTFDAFTEDNDPHGEHDFGAVSVPGHKAFWKIDYYAPDMLHGSEDPADPTVTLRVLTIMLAEEY